MQIAGRDNSIADTSSLRGMDCASIVLPGSADACATFPNIIRCFESIDAVWQC
jgi:hypothetical protein